MARLGVLGSAAVVVAILAVVVFLIYGGDTLLGFSSSFKSDIVYLLPGLTVFGIGAYMVASTRGFVLMAGFAFLSLGTAYLAGQMNALGVWVPELLTPTFAIAELQISIIVLGFVIGAVFAAATRD